MARHICLNLQQLVIWGNLSALMKRSLQFVVDVRVATAAFLLAMTSGFDLTRGIMHTRLAARSNSDDDSGSLRPGALQWIVLESHSNRSPAAISAMIGFTSLESRIIVGESKMIDAGVNAA